MWTIAPFHSPSLRGHLRVFAGFTGGGSLALGQEWSCDGSGRQKLLVLSPVDGLEVGGGIRSMLAVLKLERAK